MTRLEELLDRMAQRGFFVINLFQTQQKMPDIRQKHWRCNLMDEATSKIFPVGLGATLEDALAAAIEHTNRPPSAIQPLRQSEATLNFEDML